MNRTPHWSKDSWRFAGAAVFVATIVGLNGLYPHFRWSTELQSIAWYHNSFDEGFYAWNALFDFIPSRGLSSLILRTLHLLCGSDTQWMMIAADFCLPFGATLAAFFVVRPLFFRVLQSTAAALLIVVAAEVLGLRTNMLLTYPWFTSFQADLLKLGGGADGIFLLGNLTSAFWVFRTPEPGISWIMMFVVLGQVIRLILDPAPNHCREMAFLALCLVLGFGYIFCALSAGGAFLLFALMIPRAHRRLALLVGVGGLLCVACSLGLSLITASGGSGTSYVFSSRLPVVMICFMACLAAIGLLLVRCFMRRQALLPGHFLALALALAPLCMANQHVLTGRMIYLSNFENYGFSQLAALALLIAACQHPAVWPHYLSTRQAARSAEWLRPIIPILGIVVILALILRSQMLSYEQWLSPNRLAKSYALAIDSVDCRDQLIVCDDFVATDTLPLLLNRRPNFVLSRDQSYLQPIERLKNPLTSPNNGKQLETALFTYLIATGVTPTALAERLKAVSDDNHPNWQDRTLLGGFLYSYADFWPTLTHHRDTKLAWIAELNTQVVQRYKDRLANNIVKMPPFVIFLPADKPVPSFVPGYQAMEISSGLGLPAHPLRALRIAP